MDMTLNTEGARPALLTPERVIEMRERCAAGEPIGDLAIEFGVSRNFAARVVRGIAWATVGGPRVEKLPHARPRRKASVEAISILACATIDRRHAGAFTLGEVAELTDCPRNVTGLRLARLAEKGFVERLPTGALWSAEGPRWRVTSDGWAFVRSIVAAMNLEEKEDGDE